MSISISNDNIINRCKMLSAFEGKVLVDGSGESRYKDIRLTGLENSLLNTYITDGTDEVLGILEGAIEIQEANGNTGKTGMLQSSIEETLSAYVMYRWLAGKEESRSAAYRTLFDNMLESTKRMAWRRKRPSMNEE